MGKRRPDLENRAWRAQREWLLRVLPPRCALCGKPVDVRISGRHKQGPHIDHIIPPPAGSNHPRNCRLTHNHCNARRGRKPDPPKNSRKW